MKFDKKQYFNSREVSWVDFDYRVLEEAKDKRNPLLERLRFLGISESNLDEFFNVRVGSLHHRMKDDPEPDAAGLSPRQQLQTVLFKTHNLVSQQERIYQHSLLPQLSRHNIKIKKWTQLNKKQKDSMKKLFIEKILPQIKPTIIKKDQSFPFINNDTINIASILDKNDEQHLSIILIPNSLNRVIEVGDNEFILIENVVMRFMQECFQNYKVLDNTVFRITRNMDTDINDHSHNLKKAVEKALQERVVGKIMRLEIDKKAKPELIKFLAKHYKVSKEEIFVKSTPIDFVFVNSLLDQVSGHKDLLFTKFQPYDPEILKKHSMFDNIKHHDLFVHHPYDSFNPVIRFIQEAVDDPKVISINMTLYRVSKHSPIIKALVAAGKQGKQVNVMVELKARSDEANNLHWTDELEDAHCNVLHGITGLKIHSKVAMIERKENDKIFRYTHLATGNYNDKTAKLYTDMGIFTADQKIGEDAVKIFNLIKNEKYKPIKLHDLAISPNGITDSLSKNIDKEIQNVKHGKPAWIKMKMNSLSDTHMIQKLYEASNAGVKIELLVRGICNLRTGIPDVSENITVHSIVGRLLAHSRIYMFANDGNPKIYISSADLMKRNLSRRIEILTRINDAVIKQSIQQIYKWLWEDNVKTRVLNINDKWSHVKHPGVKSFNAQDFLIQNRKKITDKRLKETGFEN